MTVVAHTPGNDDCPGSASAATGAVNGATGTAGQVVGGVTGAAGERLRDARLAPPAPYSVPIYRQAEAARILGIPRSTLRHWAAGGAAGLVTVTRPAGRGGGRSSASIAFSKPHRKSGAGCIRRTGWKLSRRIRKSARHRRNFMCGRHANNREWRGQASRWRVLWKRAIGNIW
jgi:hypothetical protein